jgi:HD-like signal output (HDOD) protein
MAAESISPFLFAQLKASKRLPTPPGTALRVLELCRAEDADMTKIADTIKSDPALSARLLKFANSPLSGLNHAVASVREAILLLGLRTVKLTALGFSVATTGATCGCPGFSIRQFWAESFLRAVITKRLAMQSRQVDREEAFTAGLLAAIGRLALARGLAEQYAPVLEAARQGQPLLLAERSILQTDHIQFGASCSATGSCRRSSPRRSPLRELI